MDYCGPLLVRVAKYLIAIAVVRIKANRPLLWAVRLELEYCGSDMWTGNRSMLLTRIVGDYGSGTVCEYCSLKNAWSACPVL